MSSPLRRHLGVCTDCHVEKIVELSGRCHSCATHAAYVRRHGSATERFWRHVDKESAVPCWVWTASLTDHGYGQFEPRSGTRIQAHRYAFVLANGPTDLHVLHHCDNPSCVNPEHLYAGTPADNARDREERRRGNHAVKIPAGDVPTIRAALARGVSQRSLAERFGVDPSAISHIHAGRRRSA